MTAYYRAMATAWMAAADAGRFTDENGNFHFTRWVSEEFDPGQHRVPRLCVDGHAYRRRTRTRKRT